MDVKEQESVEIESLVGEHELDAVDEETTQVSIWGESFEQANVIRFRLDGKVYTAVENPDDGYRSSMETFFVSDDAMHNVFPPVKVLARVSDKYEHGGTAQVLQLLDVKNGKVVLEVGTDNTDDYYPCFVASWMPENLTVNQR